MALLLRRSLGAVAAYRGLAARREVDSACRPSISLETAFPLTMALGGVLAGCLLGSLPSLYAKLPIERDLAIKLKMKKLPETFEMKSQVLEWLRPGLAGTAACSAWLVASSPKRMVSLQAGMRRASGSFGRTMLAAARAGATVGCRSLLALTCFAVTHGAAVLAGTFGAVASRFGIAGCEIFLGWLAAACILVVMPLTALLMPFWCVGFAVTGATGMAAGAICGLRLAASSTVTGGAASLPGRALVTKALLVSPMFTCLATPFLGYTHIIALGDSMQQARLKDSRRILTDGLRGG